MILTSRKHKRGDYNKYIKSLTKENMEQLFIDNFGGWSDEVSEKKFKEVLENGFVQLFFSKDIFVGYISFDLEKGRKSSYLINDIHVVKKFQRKGYGTEILDYLMKTINCKQMKVLVFEKNPALNFYEKNGFLKAQYIEKSKTYVMRRIL